MPGLDGLEVARRVRASGFKRSIILCSAYLNAQIERDARALAVLTVSKDDLTELRAAVRREVAGMSHHEQRDQDASHLAAIVQSSDDAIVGSTLEGIVESWNPAAERIYGYSAEQMIGRPIWTLVPSDRHNEMPEVLRKVRRGEAVGHFETVRQTKDGRLIDVSVTVSPIVDRESKLIGISTISREVTERKRAEGNYFRSLLESAPDAVVITGSDGRIALVNRKTEELFGYGREQLLGQPIEVLVPQRFRARHSRHRDRYFADPKARPMGADLDLYGVHAEGFEFPVEISLSPLKTETGTIVSAAIRDVTDRKRGEERLQHALANERNASERLRELDRLKDDFLSTVSHELRTPLTAICALTDVLVESGATREDQADLLARVSNNAAEMSAMVERLLDYSRLEAGKMQLEIGPLGVRKAALRCIDHAQSALGDRRVSLNVPEDLEIEGDARGFERIFLNLLTNAAKYSADGSEIRVTATAEDGHATIVVEDEGIGIPAAQRTRVFERFYQGEVMAGSRGTGLGLSIVRRYVELLGGRVWVESEPGQGSRFCFTLPLCNAERSADEAHRSVGGRRA
jgi:PAS domain S-box-containing protein